MSTMTGANTLIDTRTDLRTDHGDHERFAHYVARNGLMEALVIGAPVEALCGKTWVPSRDPDKYPVCPECQDLYNGLPEEPSAA